MPGACAVTERLAVEFTALLHPLLLRATPAAGWKQERDAHDSHSSVASWDGMLSRSSCRPLQEEGMRHGSSQPL
ncbi:MAG TPA: hypothetical protein VIU62_01990 [Chloroflexota bacterium]|jgi:hypothetical protein